MSYLDAHGCYVRVEEKNWMPFDVWMGRIWYAGSFHRTPVVGEKISSTAVLCALHNTLGAGLQLPTLDCVTSYSSDQRTPGNAFVFACSTHSWSFGGEGIASLIET
jgi:hypothetical protein